MSISYFVVLLDPSGLGSLSIVIASAGQAAAHSLHAMHLFYNYGYYLSSPVAYLLKACSPLNFGDIDPFSYG
jgi:hypothetical protein